MAATNSPYLPSLEPCLKGETILLYVYLPLALKMQAYSSVRSWKDAYLALRQHLSQVRKQRLLRQNQSSPGASVPDHESIDPHLLAFLSHNVSATHLTNPFEPFRSPSTESRAELDSYTAAINITDAGPNGLYDVRKVKDDAIWLSNETRIAETAALRLVVLEWQSRARSLLLASTTEQNRSSTEPDTFGNSLRASSFFARSMQLNGSMTEHNAGDGAFHTDQGRKHRLLHLYLSERLHILRITDLLVRWYVEGTLFFQNVSQDSPITRLADRITNAVCTAKSNDRNDDSRLNELTGALQQRLNRLQSGSGWYAADGGNAEVEAAWLQSQVEELIPILQLLHCALNIVHASAPSIIAYFRLMVRTSFLDLQVVSSSIDYCCFDLTDCQPSTQSYTLDLTKILASLVSAKFLSGERIDRIAAPQENTVNNESVDTLNSLVIQAASSSNTLASMPIYSWVIFLMRLSDQQTQANAATLPTYLEEDNIKNLANAAVDNMGFFDVIPQVTASLRKVYKDNHDFGLENDIRLSFLQVLLFSMQRGLVVYSESIIWALLSILDIDRSYWDAEEYGVLDTSSPAQLGADTLQYWLDYARGRFPLETQTLMKILKGVLRVGAIGMEGWLFFSPYLYHSDVFTDVLNPNFNEYEEAEYAPVDHSFPEEVPEPVRYFIQLSTLR